MLYGGMVLESAHLPDKEAQLCSIQVPAVALHLHRHTQPLIHPWTHSLWLGNCLRVTEDSRLLL